MKRLLFLSPTPPWPPDSGGRIRTSALLRGLALEFEVHLWCVATPEMSKESETDCADVRIFARSSAPLAIRLTGPVQESWFWSADMARKLDANADGFDLIHVDELCLIRMLPAELMPPLLQHHHKLDRELAAALLPASARRQLELERWSLLERSSVQRTRHQVFCCEEDAARFSRRFPTAEPHIVENGVDGTRFRPGPEAREHEHLLFLGSLDYAPNVLGLVEFLRKAWPELRRELPNLQLSIVGRGARPEDLSALPPGVNWVGGVPDVRPWLARATALIVPLAIGGGTRLKIVEAAAMECPIFTTRVGLEGLRFEDGKHLRVASSITVLAPPLLEDLESRETLGLRARAARKRALEHYEWRTLAQKLASIGCAILADPR